jgi:hypothetical protein
MPRLVLPPEALDPLYSTTTTTSPAEHQLPTTRLVFLDILQAQLFTLLQGERTMTSTSVLNAFNSSAPSPCLSPLHRTAKKHSQSKQERIVDARVVTLRI